MFDTYALDVPTQGNNPFNECRREGAARIGKDQVSKNASWSMHLTIAVKTARKFTFPGYIADCLINKQVFVSADVSIYRLLYCSNIR